MIVIDQLPFIFLSIEGMILQTRNSSGKCSSSKLVKRESSSSIRCPLPLRRFASVRSNIQTNSSNKSKLSHNCGLSEIQEKEQSYSDESKALPSANKEAISDVRRTIIIAHLFFDIYEIIL